MTCAGISKASGHTSLSQGIDGAHCATLCAAAVAGGRPYEPSLTGTSGLQGPRAEVSPIKVQRPVSVQMQRRSHILYHDMAHAAALHAAGSETPSP
eukprot:CAMPEP_0195100512 /NCGR_PEP_ID=MMETSP0448-20130528/63509_1 /TAXON_ID=66468 /ORGANISM="Heterocapsa triquestra, Strain CCMP 448" /LENGTH=95 /DNA_ID=CAMNT_0040135675 /DNA_START=6 /DNA_END=294 /DNA_ORIENTATION=+